MALNSKTKPLYQPWNEEAFQSDLFVRNMKPIERWMYRTLLQSMFFHSTRPYLPNDDNVLWMLAGCETRDQWIANKGTILMMFIPVEGGELLQNKRVNDDWKVVQKARKRYSAMGRASAIKRSTYAEHKLNDGSTSKGKGSGGKGSKGKGKAKAAAASSTFQPEEV